MKLLLSDVYGIGMHVNGCELHINNDGRSKVTDFPQVPSKKQQFSCYRFWRISQKFPVIISTEILENLAESFH